MGKQKRDTQHLLSIISPSAEHIQMGGTKSEMRYADTNFLIVTCYLLPQGLETLLCLRYAFAMHSLQVRSHRWSINGFTTDLQRTWNGTALEGVPEHFSRLYIVFHAE